MCSKQPFHLQLAVTTSREGHPESIFQDYWTHASEQRCVHESTGEGHTSPWALQVTADSAGWLELNITKGVKAMWPLSHNETHVEISVVLSTDCIRKSPVVLEDPSSISLSQTKRRQRLYALQPLFLVNQMVKEIVKNEILIMKQKSDRVTSNKVSYVGLRNGIVWILTKMTWSNYKCTVSEFR